MAIPWLLVASAAAAAGAAWLWARLARPQWVGSVTDLAGTVGIGALLGARLVSLATDLLLWGAVPTPGSVISIAGGLSTPGAVLGGLAAGALAARRAGGAERATSPEAATSEADGRWRAAVRAAALGLAVWSLFSLVRGDAAGLAAPFPLGWPLPGEAEPRVPVALLEAAAYGLVFVRARRWRPGGPRLGARLAAVVAGVHLAGSLARPWPATGDGDVDVLLGLAALGAALGLPALARRGRPALARTGALAAAVVIAAVALAGVALPGRAGGRAGAATAGAAGAAEAPAGAPSLDGAVTAHPGSSGTPPAWDEDDLRRFVAAAGTPVVVSFWASWCPPCHAEAPSLARSATALAGEVTFIGVLVDDRAEPARDFARRYGLPFPTVADGGLRGALGAAGLPTTVVLRPDGTVAHRSVGGLDPAGLAAAIDRARP